MRNKTLAVYEPREVPMVGRPADLERRLRDMHDAGILVTDPRTIEPIWYGQEWAKVTVAVRVRVPAPTLLERRPWVLKLAGIAAGLALLVGAVIWLVVHTVAGLVHAAAGLAWQPIVGAVVLVWIILRVIASVTRGHACAGIHCPGCKH